MPHRKYQVNSRIGITAMMSFKCKRRRLIISSGHHQELVQGLMPTVSSWTMWLQNTAGLKGSWSDIREYCKYFLPFCVKKKNLNLANALITILIWHSRVILPFYKSRRQTLEKSLETGHSPFNFQWSYLSWVANDHGIVNQILLFIYKPEQKRRFLQPSLANVLLALCPPVKLVAEPPKLFKSHLLCWEHQWGCQLPLTVMAFSVM